MKNLLIISGMLSSMFFSAQSVGLNTRTPSSSAMLDIKTNNNHKTVILPQVNLASKSDAASINGGAPEESLIVYNTNSSIPGGKGIYYWDAADAEWKFLVSQANINVFRNLTRYYTANTAAGQTIFVGSSTLQPTAANAYTLGSDNSGWTMVKDASNNNLSVTINVDQPVNFVELNLTGTWIITDDSNLNHSIEFGYGIFIDGKLSYAKSDTKTASNLCNYSNFYINSVVPNLTTGPHVVTFGVMVRRIRQDNGGSNTYPTNSNFTIKLGGGSSVAGCNNINAFESATRGTAYLNQTL